VTSTNSIGSLIITIAFRLANFNTAGLTTNPMLLEDKFIVWTQTELSYSVMGATIPSLRPFVKSLATNYGTGAIDGHGSRYGDGIYDRYTQSGSYRMSNFRPQDDDDEYQYRIWSSRNCCRSDGEPSEAKKTDAGSTGSNESERMIVRKNLLWEVVVDPK